MPVAERLLASTSVDDRLRGVVRLGAIGTPEAIDALTSALEQSTILTRDARARLEAIRALAPHASRDNVRPLLIRELGEGPEGRANASALSSLTRGAAALALAKSGDKKALGALMSAVLQGGATAEIATMALAEHPPASLATLLEGRRRIEPAVASLLATLGDLRAQERLRLALSETDLTYQLAAAMALVRLGDSTPATLARAWVRSEDNRQRRAGAEILAKLGTEDADEAIAGLLSAAATRSDGVRLAFTSLRKELIKPLADVLETLPLDEKEKAIAAIGRAGGAEAVSVLVKYLGKPELATAAAFALARMPGKEARGALEGALSSASGQTGAPRRLIVRAATVRALMLRDEPAGFDKTLEAMVSSGKDEDLAVALFAYVATGRKTVDAAESIGVQKFPKDASAMYASIARGALAQADGPAAFMRLLRATANMPSQLAEAYEVGIALLVDPRAEGVPTTKLVQWAEEGGPLAPLAARSLPLRDSETLRGIIERLLAGTDPVIRAHTALGLAMDPEPDAVSLLVKAYRFEEDASVRRAIIRGLSGRTEPQRRATLELAQQLDPDDSVRALARAAIAGRNMLPNVTQPGKNVLWMSLVANSPTALHSISKRAARFVRPDGLAIPVVADPDGVLIIPGMPDGRGGLTLAPEPALGDAPSP